MMAALSAPLLGIASRPVTTAPLAKGEWIQGERQEVPRTDAAEQLRPTYFSNNRHRYSHMAKSLARRLQALKIFAHWHAVYSSYAFHLFTPWGCRVGQGHA